MSEQIPAKKESSNQEHPQRLFLMLGILGWQP